MKKQQWILVAEDDEPIAELTTLALAPGKATCQIVVTHDGLAALDCLHHAGEFQKRAVGNPVFVLLDLKMPGLDGWEVLRQMRSDPSLKNIPVVVFTSSREVSDVDRCYQLGANAYVVKPTAYPEFNEALQEIRKFWVELNELPPDQNHPQMTACAA